MPRHPARRLAAAVIGLLAGVADAAAQDRTQVAPQALRSDLAFVMDTLRAKHPDLENMVDAEALASQVASIDRGLTRPMDRAEAWRRFSTLNPILADGHLLIGYPDWRGEAQRTLEAGQGLFPFEVTLDDEGAPYIRAALGGEATPLAGARILRINGEDAGAVAQAMLARAHGDTPRFRRALVERRWWFFYLMLYGAPQTFDLELDGVPQTAHRASAGRVLPETLRSEERFDETFACEVRPAGGVITLGSFAWPDKARVLEFTAACFRRMQDAGATRLIIDIRDNGGGDDDHWIEGVMPYLTDRPFRTGGRYIKRTTVEDPETGLIKGLTVRGENDPVEAPHLDDSERFKGEVTVLVGPFTYSSAVLFANVMKDFGLADLAGRGGSARTRQTGGVRTATLPATGLILSYPRFILSRPSGEEEPALLTPDIEVADDPLQPGLAVDALLTR